MDNFFTPKKNSSTKLIPVIKPHSNTKIPKFSRKKAISFENTKNEAKTPKINKTCYKAKSNTNIVLLNGKESFTNDVDKKGLTRKTPSNKPQSSRLMKLNNLKPNTHEEFLGQMKFIEQFESQESYETIKIKEISKKMCNLMKGSLFNIIEQQSPNNLFDIKHENLKMSILCYDIDKIYFDSQELYEKMKLNNINFNIFNLSDSSETSLFNSTLDTIKLFENNLQKLNNSKIISDNRISVYKNCFDSCSHTLKEIISLTAELNDNIYQEETELSDICNKTITDLENEKSRICEKSFENDFYNINDCNKVIIDIYPRLSNLLSFKKAVNKIKLNIPRENYSLYSSSVSNNVSIQENISISIPNSKIKNVKKPTESEISDDILKVVI